MIVDDSLPKDKAVMALLSFLDCVDPAVMKGDPDLLIRLVDSLTQNLAGCFVYTRETFETHYPTFEVLLKTCASAYELAPQLQSNKKLQKRQREWLRRLKCLKSILRLMGKDKKSVIAEFFWRTAILAWAAVYLVHGMCFLAPASIEKAYETQKSAVELTCLSKKSWFDWLQTLSATTQLNLRTSDSFAAFKTCFDNIRDFDKNLKCEKERKALRYGIVQETRVLAIHGKSTEIQSKAVNVLAGLAEESTLPEGWNEDPTLFEALLEALLNVYQHHKHLHQHHDACQKMFKMLETMTSSSSLRLKDTIGTWLGNESLANKVSITREQAGSAVRVTLFHLVSRAIEAEVSDERSAVSVGGSRESENEAEICHPVVADHQRIDTSRLIKKGSVREDENYLELAEWASKAYLLEHLTRAMRMESFLESSDTSMPFHLREARETVKIFDDQLPGYPIYILGLGEDMRLRFRVDVQGPLIGNTTHKRRAFLIEKIMSVHVRLPDGDFVKLEMVQNRHGNAVEASALLSASILEQSRARGPFDGCNSLEGGYLELTVKIRIRFGPPLLKEAKIECLLKCRFRINCKTTRLRYSRFSI